MSLAVPIALAWAALAVPIVIFYILKIRLRQVPVSTTIFWQQIYDEKRPRSIWQILRHLVSLLVQLLLLILLVLALAQPFFSWEILQARRLVLVVDNSASMKASDVAPSRLDAACEIGRSIISGLRLRDEMAIVAAGTQPRVVCGLTDHERTLQTALAGIQPGDGPTQVAAAVALGKRLLGDAKHGRVIVLSDGCFEGSEKLLEDKLVEMRTVGTRAGNVGITNFQVRRSLIDPIGYEILTEVTAATDEPVECRLEIDLNDAPVDVIPLNLKPGETWTKAIEKTSVEGGRLTARIVAGTLRVPSGNGTRSVPATFDKLPADDSAVALLPQRREQKVVLAGQTNLFLRKSLEVNALVSLELAAKMPEQFAAGTLYVFHRQAPAKLPVGNILVIDPEGPTDLWQVGERLENPIVTRQEADSPLLAHVRLDNVLMPEARKLTPAEGHVPLVTALSGDPLYFSIDRPGQKVLVLTVNLDQGDLTFRTAFPIMITNALGWFAGQAGELRESLAAGAVTEIELPPGEANASPLVLRSPSGRTRPLPAGLAKTSIGPLDECGVWEVVGTLRVPSSADSSAASVPTTTDDGTRSVPTTLACNLANRSESDLRVPEKLLAANSTATTAASWLSRPVWFYLVALAWALAATEWFLYQRRWIS
ncbi:MAG: BatA and WFA domain-containing protein [Planctomycetaceae bacterium]|nr:BatA and WFA domain-containing protein [Planctomycetaceae bacterium]